MATSHAETHHARSAAAAAGDDIEVRAIAPSDVFDAIKLGFADFNETPSHLLMLGLLYPLGAALLAGAALDQELIPLIFPIAGGLALLGPFAAIILYEISRRHETGVHFSWGDARSIFMSALTGPVITLGVSLLVVFGIWLVIAQVIFEATIGAESFSTPTEFIAMVLTTSEGWALIALGNGVGFLFAAAVLATNVVSFPMLLDRDVGPGTAIATSLRVTAKSPFTVALWGLIIALSMVVGAAFFLVGLAVVLPVLGHASWRIYRAAVRY